MTDAASKPETTKLRVNRDWSGATFWLFTGVVALVLGRLGSIWPRFDVFSQFYVQAACICTGAILALFLPRYKGAFAVALTALLIALYGLLPHFAKNSDAAAAPKGFRALRILSWNIHDRSVEKEKAAAILRKSSADVVVLSEAYILDNPLYDAVRDIFPNRGDCYALSGNCNLIVLSKFPFAARPIETSKGDYPAIIATFGPELGGLTLVGLHAARFPYSNVQQQQFAIIEKELRAHSGDLIVAGDFNATPQSGLLRRFATNLDLSVQTYLPTYPADFGFPQLAIDHVLTSPKITRLSEQVIGEASGSDHYPISMTLSVPLE